MTLDEYMREKNVPTGVLAARVGVNQSYISHLRARRRRPSLKVAIKLAEETGLPIETFMEAA